MRRLGRKWCNVSQSHLILRIIGVTSLVVQWLSFHAPNAGSPGSFPDQGTRFHMLQLRVCMLQLIPSVAKYINLQKKKKNHQKCLLHRQMFQPISPEIWLIDLGKDLRHLTTISDNT